MTVTITAAQIEEALSTRLPLVCKLAGDLADEAKATLELPEQPDELQIAFNSMMTLGAIAGALRGLAIAHPDLMTVFVAFEKAAYERIHARLCDG